MLLRSLGLVEALESTVMALSEPPGLVVRNPEGIHRLRDGVVGLEGSRKDRGVSHIELKAFLLEEMTGMHSLLLTLRGEVNVVPASEPVLEVPGGLAVADKDDLVEGLGSDHCEFVV